MKSINRCLSVNVPVEVFVFKFQRDRLILAEFSSHLAAVGPRAIGGRVDPLRAVGTFHGLAVHFKEHSDVFEETRPAASNLELAFPLTVTDAADGAVGEGLPPPQPTVNATISGNSAKNVRTCVIPVTRLCLIWTGLLMMS